MPQRKQVTWAQLRVGLLTIVSLAIFSVGIFFISGQTGFLSRKYVLKAYFSGASGLRLGADVRVAGIHVGTVRAIRLSPYPDPNRAVEVVMSIPRTYQNQIRADSAAHLATAGLLGEAFVDISRGKPDQPAVTNEGEIKSIEEADIKRIVQNTNDVIANLRVLSQKLNDITGQIGAGRGTMGKLIYDDALYGRLNSATGTAQRLLSGVEKGQGALGKLLEDDTLYQRTLAAIDRINQVVDDVQHGKGSLAKFLNDPGVYDQVNQAVARLNTLADKVNSNQGTLGKLVNDPQLYDRMNQTLDHVKVIAARIDQGQGTLGRLSTDDTLYKNMSTSSQTLRDFLMEFRKNPKKFLTLRVHLF
jgi:phospholipid/cholesterol/gamma-HCH transport system substrate-binding protein